MTKRPIRTFLNLEQINPNLFCPICGQVFDGPVVTPCGHSYCYQCITIWMDIQFQCPVCKVPYQVLKPFRNRVINAIIKNLETKCCHPQCQWLGKYRWLKWHQKRCSFGLQKQKIQIPPHLVIDLEDNQPKLNSVNRSIHKKDVINTVHKKYNFILPPTQNIHLSFLENYSDFTPSDKEFIQPENKNYQQFCQDGSSIEGSKSSQMRMDEEINTNIQVGVSNSISTEKRHTRVGSSSETKRKSRNELNQSKNPDTQIQTRLRSRNNRHKPLNKSRSFIESKNNIAKFKPSKGQSENKSESSDEWQP